MHGRRKGGRSPGLIVILKETDEPRLVAQTGMEVVAHRPRIEAGGSDMRLQIALPDQASRELAQGHGIADRGRALEGNPLEDDGFEQRRPPGRIREGRQRVAGHRLHEMAGKAGVGVLLDEIPALKPLKLVVVRDGKPVDVVTAIELSRATM